MWWRRHRLVSIPVGGAALLAPRRLLGTGGADRFGPAPGERRRWRRADPVPDLDRPTVPLPAERRGDEPVVAVVVLDESPSEQEADPQGHRHAAARRIVELLRGDLVHPDDRVAVVHFTDQPAPVLRATSPHSRAGHRRLRRALRPTRGAPATDIAAALRAAQRVVPARWRGRVVVLLMTDGYDANPPTVLRTAIDGLPPGSLHVLSVDGPLPDAWDAMALGSVAVVPGTARPDHVEWAAARALYRALGLAWTGPSVPPGAG